MIPEFSTTSIFPHALSGLGGSLFAVVLALVAIGLMFAGRRIIKGLAFLVVGLAGAAAGVTAGGALLGPVGAVVGGVVGFLVGGAIGLLLVSVGMGLALGYYGYLAARFLTQSLLVAAFVGILLFVVGLVIAARLLELVSAIVGGVVFYGVLVYFGVGTAPAALVSLLLATVGFLVQFTERRRREPWRH